MKQFTLQTECIHPASSSGPDAAAEAETLSTLYLPAVD